MASISILNPLSPFIRCYPSTHGGQRNSGGGTLAPLEIPQALARKYAGHEKSASNAGKARALVTYA